MKWARMSGISLANHERFCKYMGISRTQYDVDPDRCYRDLVALLKQLAEAGLIKLLHENSG